MTSVCKNQKFNLEQYTLKYPVSLLQSEFYHCSQCLAAQKNTVAKNFTKCLLQT